MTGRPAAIRVLPVDGSPERVAELTAALAAALDGGPAVLPVGPGVHPPATDGATGRPAVLLATSGSTGDAKLVMLSAAALTASALATAARLGGPARWLLALPAEHVAGVQVIVRALLAGAAPAVQDVRGGFRPDDFAAATARLPPGSRRCTSLVPTQLRRLLDAVGAGLEALRSYDAVLVGGAALDAGLRERARLAQVRVVGTYGMSETAGGCVYDGIPLDGVTVELADGVAADGDGEPTGGNPAPAGAGPACPRSRPATGGTEGGGRILVGGPTLADGYLGCPAETAAAFAGGQFRTGDLGRWHSGLLEVLGRADDVIVTGGEKVPPAAVERVLAAQPGVRSSCVVGLPDPEWGQIVAAAVVGVPGSPPAPDALRAAVRAALGRAAVPRLLLAVAELPLHGVGKPDRTAVARLLAAAQLAIDRQASP